MISHKLRIGFVAQAVVAAAGMCFFASGAFAGWVIESENDAPKTQGPGGKPGAPSAPGSKEGHETQKLTMKLQDKMTRMDADAVSIIFDGEAGDQMILIHEKKTYLKMSAEQMKEMREMMEKLQAKEAAGASDEVVKATATGKTDKINGFNVEEYVAQFPTRKVTYWVTKDGVNVERMRDAMLDAFSRLQPTSANKLDFKSLPGYPIRTIEESQDRKITLPNGQSVTIPGGKTTHTVKSIKEEAIDGGVFKVPGDYTLMQQPKMPTGAGAPGGATRPPAVKKP